MSSYSLKLVCLAMVAMVPFAGYAGKGDNSINAAFGQGASTLDYYKEADRGGIVLARMVYDSLLSKDLATNQFKPELATGYEFVGDKAIDLQIRRGVKFHDGSPLTADDVAYTLNLVSAPSYGARYQTNVDWIEKVEKTGDYSVRIHMKRPFPAALEMLAGNLPIYPKEYYSKVGSEGMAVKPVGTGPYKAVEIVPGTRFTFERFDDYYENSPKGKPAVQKVTVRVLPEANTQYAELASGQLDWIWRLPLDASVKLAKLPSVKVQSAQLLRFEYVALNPFFDNGKGPTSDIRVRRALAMALNRSPIRQAFYGGSSQLLKSACSPQQFGCAQDVRTYPYDPAAAKKLLAEAGYPNGLSLEAISVLPNATVNAALVASWKEAGINVKIISAPYATGLADWRAGKTPIFISTWGSYGIGDIALSTSLFFGGNADDHYKDAVVTELLKKGDNSVDTAVRLQAYKEALERIADQSYWIPLWTVPLYSAQNKDLDLVVTPDEFVPFWQARWK